MGASERAKRGQERRLVGLRGDANSWCAHRFVGAARSTVSNAAETNSQS